MKTITKKLIFLLFIGLLIISCSKDPLQDATITAEDTELKKFDDQSGNLLYSKLGSSYSKTEARRILAKATAAALAAHPPLLSMFVEEAKKEFNGDTEILYALFKDKETPKGKLYEVLQHSFEKRYDEQLPEDFFKEELLKADPYSTFYLNIPHMENPELLNKPVTVAFEAAEIDDTKAEFYEGYNFKGKKVKVDGYTPNEVLIGIKANERILLVDKKTMTTINGNDFYSIVHYLQDPCDQLANAIVDLFIEALISGEDYLVVELEELWHLYLCICLEDCEEPDYDGDGGSDDEECEDPEGCDRTLRKDKDEVYKFKFTSCAAYSATGTIFDGRREIQATITYASLDAAGNVQLQTIPKISSFERSTLRDANWVGTCQSTNWVNVYWETRIWDYCTHGENVHVQWSELDNPDATGSIDIGFNFELGPINIPINATIPFANAHDNLGASIVEYCDDAEGSGYLYNTGSIKFYFRMEP